MFQVVYKQFPICVLHYLIVVCEEILKLFKNLPWNIFWNLTFCMGVETYVCHVNVHRHKYVHYN